VRGSTEGLGYLIVDAMAYMDMELFFITHSIEEAIRLSGRVLFVSNSPAQIIEEIVIDLPRPSARGVLTRHRRRRCAAWNRHGVDISRKETGEAALTARGRAKFTSSGSPDRLPDSCMSQGKTG
jgi:hypothetical protein